MIKEINYNDIFRSKCNRIEQDNECTTPLEGVRFVTKSFKEKNDVLSGSSLHGKYVSFNPDKLQHNNVFTKLYNNYMWQLWKMAGEPSDVEVSYADSIILYELDSLSCLAHISAPDFGNKILRLGQNIDTIKRQYPDFNGKAVFDKFNKNWIHYRDLDLYKYSKIKLGLDLRVCKDDAMRNLANQKWSKFKNEALDNNVELVSNLPEQVLAEAVKCGILDKELGEPLFFTTENKHINSISDRIRLHGDELDIFSMY